MGIRHRPAAGQADKYDGTSIALYFSILGIAILAATIYSLVAHLDGSRTPQAFGIGDIAAGFVATTILFVMAGYLVRNGLRTARDLTQLRADALPERARRAAAALQEATVLVDEMKAELNARTALLADVKRQVAETSRRAEDMEKLARVDDETTRILNKYFDKVLASRLKTLEHGARRREWLLGTVGALLFGIIAILLSHYLLRF